MGKDYEVGSEAPDLIFTSSADIYSSGTIHFNYSTATGIDDLLWEWATGSDLSFDFISSELKYADIEIVEDHIDLKAWEDFDEAAADTEKEIDSYRKGSDDDQV